jgi:hypothetical protein
MSQDDYQRSLRVEVQTLTAENARLRAEYAHHHETLDRVINERDSLTADLARERSEHAAVALDRVPALQRDLARVTGERDAALDLLFDALSYITPTTSTHEDIVATLHEARGYWCPCGYCPKPVDNDFYDANDESGEVYSDADIAACAPPASGEDVVTDRFALCVCGHRRDHHADWLRGAQCRDCGCDRFLLAGEQA